VKALGRLRAQRAQRDRGQAGLSVRMLSIRVALAASAVVGIAYLVIAIFVAVVVSNNLTSEIDAHLTQVLQIAGGSNRPGVAPGDNPLGGPGFDPGRQDPRGLPVLAWQVAGGKVAAMGLTNLTLPVEDWYVLAPKTVKIDGADYRLAGMSVGLDWYVVGQSTYGISQTQSTLVVAEFGIGCALLIFVFLGSVAVGRRVALPIERARQRQLEFTADASHELRTPLSVIEAQATLALARDRDPARDAAAFGSIDTELKRSRRLVDDMLWLARFDSTGGLPQAEPVDLRVLAAQTADRFAAVADTRGQHLEVRPGSTAADAIVTAAPDWLDRLVGILLDNALKYSPSGGNVTVGVAGEGRRVRLTVDDSGPGIPEAERGRIFDRFHRATDQPGGAGLGLAIADAIVHATGGRWHIGTSPAGGASVGVSWPRSMSGHRESRSSE
jgi:signal transduction histidine kinase